MDWDYKPFALYQPPRLDFSVHRKNECDVNIDIAYVTKEYLEFLGGI
jgi:hypothetical protein